MSCLLVPSYWTFLRKKEDKKQRNRGRRREGMQGYALGTLWEKPSRKGKGARDKGRPCLLVPSHWTFLRNKTRSRGNKGEEGKECKAMPFYCKGRCGRNLLERERGKRQGRGHALLCFLLGFLEKKEKTTGK